MREVKPLRIGDRVTVKGHDDVFFVGGRGPSSTNGVSASDRRRENPGKDFLGNAEVLPCH